MKAARHHTLRLAAALLIALWVGMPLAWSIHAEDHAHVYCAEHGSVEEARGGSSRERAGDAVTAAAESSHESCVFIALSTRSADVPPTTQERPDASLRLSAAGLNHAEAQYATVPVLHRAPKSSPPRA